MKKIAASVIISAVFGLANAQATLISNGDFETAAGDEWNLATSAGSTITFETTGGNSGGFGRIDSTGGTWGGVLVAEGGTGPAPAAGGGIPLASLGLVAGSSYDIVWDQIDLLGNGAIAGAKVESWDGGGLISDSGDQLFATAATWQTETFNYTIAPTATAIKIVLVQNQGFVDTAGSLGGISGFDNIQVVPEPGSLALVGLGAAILGFFRRRR